MDDLDYLRALYAAGGNDYFDILSANAFGLQSGPDEPPDPSKLNFQRVALAREIMEENGDSNKAVWINEYGWNASPPDFPPDKLIWGRVTEQQQAEYTVRGIAEARAKWPWIGVFNIWYFRQVGDHAPDQSDYYFRMVDVDFTPRLVYQRLKEVASARCVAKPGQYEETNPSMELLGPGESMRGNWQPRLDPHDSAGREVVTRQPGARAVVTFWGDSLDLIVRRGPNGARAWITIDGKTIPTLPLDVNGHSFIDLASPNDEYRATVAVARNLPRGQHRLELVVGQNGEVALDGFAVRADGTHEFPWVPVAALASALTLAGLLFAKSVSGARHRAAPTKG
jgi:hypothetical protein